MQPVATFTVLVPTVFYGELHFVEELIRRHIHGLFAGLPAWALAGAFVGTFAGTLAPALCALFMALRVLWLALHPAPVGIVIFRN